MRPIDSLPDFAIGEANGYVNLLKASLKQLYFNDADKARNPMSGRIPPVIYIPTRTQITGTITASSQTGI